jgi:hypothetical protein
MAGYVAMQPVHGISQSHRPSSAGAWPCRAWGTGKTCSAPVTAPRRKRTNRDCVAADSMAALGKPALPTSRRVERGERPRGGSRHWHMADGRRGARCCLFCSPDRRRARLLCSWPRRLHRVARAFQPTLPNVQPPYRQPLAAARWPYRARPCAASDPPLPRLRRGRCRHHREPHVGHDDALTVAGRPLSPRGARGTSCPALHHVEGCISV